MLQQPCPAKACEERWGPVTLLNYRPAGLSCFSEITMQFKLYVRAAISYKAQPFLLRLSMAGWEHPSVHLVNILQRSPLFEIWHNRRHKVQGDESVLSLTIERDTEGSSFAGNM